MDIILFGGGCIFLALGFLSFFNRDALWKLYSKEKGWRKNNPERTPDWDVRTKRMGVAYIVIGLAAVVFSFLAGGIS